MNVEARDSVRDAWEPLEGRVVNGVFPLRRLLGRSDHSGVFLTEFAKREPSEAALKLVPAIPAVAEAQLSHWLAAVRFDHPHLLRIWDAGRCQLDGVPYLYAVMEYADQNLAQLLEHRALTDDEAREMLGPMLSALAFLHDEQWVQGQLKPSNILVVGDQLKLASDTIRPVGEAAPSDDVWALGVGLCEALTRRQPSRLHDGAGSVVLPPDLSPTFRDVVAQCLSGRPADRPDVSQLARWARGEAMTPTPAPAAPTAAAPTAAAPTAAAPTAAAPTPAAAFPHPPVTRDSAKQSTSVEAPPTPRVVPLMLGAIAVFVLTLAGMRLLKTHLSATPPATQAAQHTDSPTPPAPLNTPGESAPTPSDTPPRAPVSSALTEEAEPAVPPSGVHEELPDVPSPASQTIRGHVRVSVRVIVDPDGTVFAALADNAGPSRYFERLAIEAAKKWTFPPVDADAQRIMLLRFDFTREGTTAQAVTVR